MDCIAKYLSQRQFWPNCAGNFGSSTGLPLSSSLEQWVSCSSQTGSRVRQFHEQSSTTNWLAATDHFNIPGVVKIVDRLSYKFISKVD